MKNEKRFTKHKLVFAAVMQYGGLFVRGEGEMLERKKLTMSVFCLPLALDNGLNYRQEVNHKPRKFSCRPP